MRLATLFFALVVFVLAGCDKTEENKEFSATYTGGFVRTSGSPSDCPMVSNITLYFTKNSFTGTSNVRNYPAICSGTFTINQSKLTITNSCYFTADFDWTLLFNGEYHYEQNGNQLRIWRTYANGMQDIYELTKED